MKKGKTLGELGRVRLPFQYTKEGRDQIAERLNRYYKGAKIAPKIEVPDFPALDLSVVTTPLTYVNFETEFKSVIINRLRDDPNVTLQDAIWDPKAEGCMPPHPPESKPKKDDRKIVRSHASYLSQLIESPDTTIAKFRAKMRKVDFDTLVGTGLSGALSVPMLARSVGCNFAVVRKDGDNTHSAERVEGNVGRRWVFVDDLVCTGLTRTRVMTAMKAFCELHSFETEYVGQYLYYGNAFNPHEVDGNV